VPSIDHIILRAIGLRLQRPKCLKISIQRWYIERRQVNRPLIFSIWPKGGCAICSRFMGVIGDEGDSVKAKYSGLIILSAISSILFFLVCGKTSPTSPNITPKDLSIPVLYIRVAPINLAGANVADLFWSYPNYNGQVQMRSQDEDSFIATAQIKTETKIRIYVYDMRKYPPNVRKRILIDGHELLFAGTVDGYVEFIYHNDWSIEVTSPN